MSDPPKEDLDNVVKIPEQDVDGKPWLTLCHGAEYCGHMCQVVLDLDARTLACSRCEAVLDPYDVLNRIARHEETMLYTIQRKRALEAQTKELKKEEKRIKSRIRHAKKSDLIAAETAAQTMESKIQHTIRVIESGELVTGTRGGKSYRQEFGQTYLNWLKK